MPKNVLRGSSTAGAGESLLRQERAHSATRFFSIARWIMLASGVAILGAGLLHLSTTAAVSVGAVIAVGATIVDSWWYKREQMIAMLCAVATAGMVIGETFLLDAGGTPQHNWLAAMLGVLACAMMPFAVARHVYNRGVTSLYAQIGVLFGVGVGQYTQIGQLVVMFVWLGVVMWFRSRVGVRIRASRARLRSHIESPTPVAPNTSMVASSRSLMNPKYVRAGRIAEQETAKQLARLRTEGWRVLYSRRLPDTEADQDALVIGPGGFVVTDTKDWSGEITVDMELPDTLGDVNTRAGNLTARYVPKIDGYADRFEERFGAIDFELELLLPLIQVNPERDLHLIVAMTDRMKLPDDLPVHLDRLIAYHGQTMRVQMTILHQSDLVDFMRAMPVLRWTTPSLVERLMGKLRGEPIEVTERKAIDRYVNDLADAMDYSLTPN